MANFKYEIQADGTIPVIETFMTQLDSAMTSQFSDSYYTIEISSETDRKQVKIVGERTEAMGDLDNSVIVNYLNDRIGNCEIVLRTDKTFEFIEEE